MTCDQCRACRNSRDLDVLVHQKAERRPLRTQAANASLSSILQPNGQLPVWEMGDIRDSIADAPRILVFQAGLYPHWVLEIAGHSLANPFAVVVCRVAALDDMCVSLLTPSGGPRDRSA